MFHAILADSADNVATAIAALTAGSDARVKELTGERTVRVIDDIAYGHKFAVTDIAAEAHIIKYGELVGKAASAIATGAHVHVHNVDSLRAQSTAGVPQR